LNLDAALEAPGTAHGYGKETAMTDGGTTTVTTTRQRGHSLEGTTALVTAGGGALGSASAAALARDGAHVLIAGRTQTALEEAAERIAAAAAGGPGTVRWAVADALIEDEVVKLVAQAAEPTGYLNAAVGVVGGGAVAAHLIDTSVTDLLETYRKSVAGTFLLIKHAGRAMLERGGSIVAMSSMQATQPAPFLGPYCASKAGLEMLCQVAADELGQYGIRINMVRPGMTYNGRPRHPASNPEAIALQMEQQPLQRVGQPEDIAAAVRYLAGPESSWVTAAAITVDGGASIRRFPELGWFWTSRTT
jgi:NAD(P)-dependent dehydrogenase (short-subunit alcohol dehydrogenase family)